MLFCTHCFLLVGAQGPQLLIIPPCLQDSLRHSSGGPSFQAGIFFGSLKSSQNDQKEIFQRPTWRAKRIYVSEPLKFRRENVCPAGRGLTRRLSVLQSDRSLSGTRQQM